jgi:hypothetical protein
LQSFMLSRRRRRQALVAIFFVLASPIASQIPANTATGPTIKFNVIGSPTSGSATSAAAIGLTGATVVSRRRHATGSQQSRRGPM